MNPRLKTLIAAAIHIVPTAVWAAKRTNVFLGTA